VRVITETRGRASMVSSSRYSCRARRRGGLLLAVAFAASGCTLTRGEFEPNQVETGDLTDLEAPSPPSQTPAGGTTRPSPTPEGTEGVDPSSFNPADIGDESAGGENPDTLGSDVEPGGDQEPWDAGSFDAGTFDAGTPDSVAPSPEASEPPPSEPPPDASTPPANPPPLAEPEPEPCPGTTFRDSCYQFFAERLSWHVAEERCVQWGGHLASVESAEEDLFVGVWPALLGVPVGDGSGIWLGGTDARHDGDFRWADDRSLSFVGWAPNQPDNGQGVDCIQKRNDTTARWYDLRCTDGQPYVCERPRE
jgi:Lectin C-type domain